MTTSDIFVKILEAHGIEYCFALPGEENLDFLEALRKSKIKLIVTRHEQAAAFMAATYGRLTGKPGVCLSTLGPGAMNLVNGAAYATLGGLPLIAITGQKALHNNWQGRFQIVDVVGVMRPITKWATSVEAPEKIAQVAERAVTLAAAERPGAVHIEIAEDVAGMEISASATPPRPLLRSAHSASSSWPRGQDKLLERGGSQIAPAFDAQAIQVATKLIKSAKRPIIIVSSGGSRARVTPELIKLVESTGLYVIGTQLGKGVLPDDHPQSLFALGLHHQDYVNAAIDASDLLITIGYHINEHPPSLWNKNKNKPILHLAGSTAETDEYYQPTAEVTGRLLDILTALTAALPGTQFNFPEHAALREKLIQKYAEKSDDPSFPLRPQRIVADVRAVMGREDIVTLDNGIYKLWFARQYRTYAPNTLLLDNTLATMGAGLPSAMAAKLLYPEKKVLAVCGDGGFMMNSQELATCVKENIPVVTLILNDNAYGFIEWKQRGAGLPDFAMKLQNPDFVKYAESYGALGLRVESAADLIPKLKAAFASGRPALVECPIDYSENYRVFTEELKNI